MAKLHKVLLDVFVHPLKTANAIYLSSLKTKFLSKKITNLFHTMYYRNEKRTWSNTYWFGCRVLKCPLDLFIYQEILYKIKPDYIIETGTAFGGSALYFASLLDLLGKGHVYSIDLNEITTQPTHERVTYITSSSTDDKVHDLLKSVVKPTDKVVVILDSDHSKQHVLNELNLFSQYVSLDSYMIVEDSNQSGHPVSPFMKEGPMEAIHEFLSTRSDFEIDKEQEKFYLTFNPDGYLKRIAR